MSRPQLIIVCGVPGSGKSTLALHAAERWGAVSFASETFADTLGPAARTAAGDLSKAAIAHAYSAMGAAVTAALAVHDLVIAVGSFRSEDQRRRFRDLATTAGAGATTIRVGCSVQTAAQRVGARIALGERGPTADAIGQIDIELNRARDIDLALTNEAAVADFHRQIDEMIGTLPARGPLPVTMTVT